MKELGLATLPIDEIDAADRLRPVDSAHVALLAENIEQTGRLRTPIEVRKLKKGGYRLIAGGHRLAACIQLGWTEIAAFCFEATDAEAKLAEIDENLVRHELNPLDKAMFLAERKSLYEALHPESKQGKAGAEVRHRATEIISFARDTAERVGLTERAIRLSVMIATKLDPLVRRQIAGTWIAKNQSELLQLVKSETPAEQRAIVAELLADEPRAKRVADARRLVTGAPIVDKHPDDKAFDTLYSQWGRASAAAKRAFLGRLQAEGEIEKYLPQREMETA